VDCGVAVTPSLGQIFQRDALENPGSLPTSDASREPIEPRRTPTITAAMAAAIAAVLAAMVLAVLDAAIVNVALPSIAHSLQVTPSASVWVITAYQTALVMGLLPCAALGESWGHRRVFAGGVALFTAASVLCALSPSLPWLVAARFLQGLGAAAVMALGIALLRLVVPPRQLGAALGWNALAVALASAAGPTLGALILSGMSWPWLFALNLPLGLLVLMASRALPDLNGTARRLDWFSVALNATAFALLVMGAEMLIDRPVRAAALFAAGALGLVALLRREMPKQVPLIPLDLLRVTSFRVSVIASICCFAGVTISLLALPFYLQHSLGQTNLMTGLYMTPWPLTVAVAAPLAGRLARRVPTAWLCAAGGVCLAMGLAAASLMPRLLLQGNPLPLVLLTMLCGLGFGLFQVPNNRNMLLAAPSERSGAAGGMQATARLVGQTAGGVIMSLLFRVASVDAAPMLGLGMAAVLTLAAGIVSMLRVKPIA
jgi:MFS transporter, DHA2 family, multidrug resistance protein